uniref:Uncharacterized protein n=1 Tax=Rhizophora mucronata TaxID=61149 RepID=A0A2P2K1C4_RHIMU
MAKNLPNKKENENKEITRRCLCSAKYGLTDNMVDCLKSAVVSCLFSLLDQSTTAFKAKFGL